MFRSSKLREVISGSEILNNFLENVVPNLIKKYNGERVISGGGTIFAAFSTIESALEFSEILAELYKRELDSTLTITPPIEFIKDAEFNKDALENAYIALVKIKREGHSPSSIQHIPYIETCSSCGLGMASFIDPVEDRSICKSCYNKSKARTKTFDNFLGKFEKSLKDHYKLDLDLSLEKIDEFAGITDPRNYIAYLLADGNDMGAVFHSCRDVETIQRLSDTLEETVYKSLCYPTSLLIENNHFGDDSFIPLIPLIIGGDDILTIIPAPYCVDFTQKFIKQYELTMGDLFKDLEINTEETPATVSAAIVICKSSFPYKMAHEIGENLLNNAKSIAKTQKKSAISTLVITRSDQPLGEVGANNIFKMNYLAFFYDNICNLIDYRLELKEFPQTKQAKLRKLYYDSTEMNFQDMKDKWVPKLNNYLNRLEEDLRKRVSKALQDLGDKKKIGFWKEIDGNHYNGIINLLDLWNFSYKIELKPTDYEVE